MNVPLRHVPEQIYLHLVPRSKNEWSYTSTPPLHLHGVVLKAQGNFTFTFYC